MKRTAITDSIAAKLRALYPEVMAILYGSEARGDARDNSDVDLLILVPDSYEGKRFIDTRRSISGMLYELALDLNVEISPLILLRKVFFRRITPFTANVMNEGIVL